LEANVGKPLLDVLRELTLDPGKQAAFADNPSGYLAQYGYEDVEADHLNEAFSLVADTLPPDVAQAVASTNPVATAAAVPLDPDDGRGGAPDTTINPHEDAFGGVDEAFDTMALNGVADGRAGGLDPESGAEAGTEAGPQADTDPGGYGTGELALDDIGTGGSGDPDDLGAGDAVAFGVGSEAPDASGLGAATADLTGGEGGAAFVDHADDSPGFLDGGVDHGDGAAFVDHADDSPGFLDDDVNVGHVGPGDATVDVDGIVDVDGPSGDASFDDVGSF
jgi:hypothetical protein